MHSAYWWLKRLTGLLVSTQHILAFVFGVYLSFTFLEKRWEDLVVALGYRCTYPHPTPQNLFIYFFLFMCCFYVVHSQFDIFFISHLFTRMEIRSTKVSGWWALRTVSKKKKILSDIFISFSFPSYLIIWGVWRRKDSHIEVHNQNGNRIYEKIIFGHGNKGSMIVIWSDLIKSCRIET